MDLSELLSHKLDLFVLFPQVLSTFLFYPLILLQGFDTEARYMKHSHTYNPSDPQHSPQNAS